MYSNGLPTLVHTLVTLRGRPVVGALVLLNVVPTNNTSDNVIDSISMVDDGRADPDLVAGDGIYSAYVFDQVGPIKLEVEVREGSILSSTFTSAFTFISIFLLNFSTVFTSSLSFPIPSIRSTFNITVPGKRWRWYSLHSKWCKPFKLPASEGIEKFFILAIIFLVIFLES